MKGSIAVIAFSALALNVEAIKTKLSTTEQQQRFASKGDRGDLELFKSSAAFKHHTSELFTALNKKSARRLNTFLYDNPEFAKKVTPDDVEAIVAKKRCRELSRALGQITMESMGAMTFECFRHVASAVDTKKASGSKAGSGRRHSHRRHRRHHTTYAMKPENIGGLSSDVFRDGGKELVKLIDAMDIVEHLKPEQIRSFDKHNCSGITGKMLGKFTPKQLAEITPSCFSHIDKLKDASIEVKFVAKMDQQIMSKVAGRVHRNIWAGLTTEQARNIGVGRDVDEQCDNIMLSALSPHGLAGVTPTCYANHLALLERSTSPSLGELFRRLPTDILSQLQEVEHARRISDRDWTYMLEGQLKDLLAHFPTAAAFIPESADVSKILVAGVTADVFRELKPRHQLVLLSKHHRLHEEALSGVSEEHVSHWSVSAKHGLGVLTHYKVPSEMLRHLGRCLHVGETHPCASFTTKKQLFAVPELIEVMSPSCFSALSFGRELTDAECKDMPASARMLMNPSAASAEEFAAAIRSGYCQTAGADSLHRLPRKAWAALTPECLAELSGLSVLSEVEVRDLPPASVVLIDDKKAAEITNLSWLTPEQITQLSSGVDVSRSAGKAFTETTITKMSTSQLGALTAVLLEAMPESAFRGFRTATQVAALKAESLVRVTADQLRNKSEEALASFDRQQIAMVGSLVKDPAQSPRLVFTEAIKAKLAKESQQELSKITAAGNSATATGAAFSLVLATTAMGMLLF